MSEPNSLLMYRFHGTQKVYGPGKLKWFVGAYSDREDCEAAFGGSEEEATNWHPAAHFRELLLVMPPTERQVARLKTLGVKLPEGLTEAKAAALIRKASSLLAPTTTQLKKLTKLGGDPTQATTRAKVKKLIEDAKDERIADQIRALGGEPPSRNKWDFLEDMRFTLQSIENYTQEAETRGLHLPPRDGLTLKEVNKLYDHHEDFWSASQDLEKIQREFVDQGLLERAPTKEERHTLAPILFQLIQDGRWRGSEAGWIRLLGEVGIGKPPPPDPYLSEIPEGGCMLALLQFMWPL